MKESTAANTKCTAEDTFAPEELLPGPLPSQGWLVLGNCPPFPIPATVKVSPTMIKSAWRF